MDKAELAAFRHEIALDLFQFLLPDVPVPSGDEWWRFRVQVRSARPLKVRVGGSPFDSDASCPACVQIIFSTIIRFWVPLADHDYRAKILDYLRARGFEGKHYSDDRSYKWTV